MHGHAIAQMILADRGAWSAAALMASLSLVASSGLLRPLRRRARVTRPPSPRPDRASSSTTRLNAIELALIAELNLERARAHDEVANDHTQRPEARRRASAAAAAWRERARLFQLQARRESARPGVPAPDSMGAPATPYGGPDRRDGADRRQGDRRRPDGPPTAMRGVA